MRPKLIMVILCASALALTGAIVGVARSKGPVVTEGSKGFEVAAPISERIKLRQETTKTGSGAGAATIPAFHWSEVESADYKEYIAKLRAVQCPEDTIRDIIVADINKLYAPREAPFKLVVEAPEDSSGDWHADRPRR